MTRLTLLLALASACDEGRADDFYDDGPDAPPIDAALDDAAPDADSPLSYGERCGDAVDNDADGLVDEECGDTLFSGVFAPSVSADPVLTTIETATGRSLAVLQTYHSMTKLGIERTEPDLAAIFARGQVAHLNVEPSGYTAAQYATPTTAPIATDLAAMGEAITAALVVAPRGRVFLTFGAEMNGNWTDWGCLTAAQYHALYRAAFDVITAKLDAAGVDRRRVRWAYGPDARGTNSCATGPAYYPGHAYVDLIGLSAYRAGTESVADAVTTPMTTLFGAMPATWQQNRFIVLQTGSRVPDRDAWLSALYAQMAADRRVAGVIYFDASADWTIPVDGPGWDAWTAAMAAAPVADAQLDAVFLPHFWDAPYSLPAFPEIQALRDTGVTTGCGTAPPRFCPDEPLARRDAAIWLARAFDLPAGSPTPVFADVPTDAPGFAEIQALAAVVAPAGCGEGRFCPDEAVSEAELYTMLTALGTTPGAVTAVDATRARAAQLIAPAARLVPRPL